MTIPDSFIKLLMVLPMLKDVMQIIGWSITIRYPADTPFGAFLRGL